MLKVLFVCSGNNNSDISPIVKAQANTLVKKDINIEFYPIKGKGLSGYIYNFFLLRKFLKGNHYDLVHAHYGLSAIAATFAGANPLVVSLMGSDVKLGGCQLYVIRFFARYIWGATIVKSLEMADIIGKNHVQIIPNGVDTKLFCPINSQKARTTLGLKPEKTYLLFASDPERPEKNFYLTKKAIEKIGINNLGLLILKNIPYSLVPLYLNASDVIIISSKWEGSPNSIKEAMACNRPIVSTDVGDVRRVINNIDGCFISSFNPEDMAEKVKMALDFGNKTEGRKRINELGLDSETIAEKLFKLYKKVLEN